MPDRREAIAHCPRRYDTLEIELVDGTPLTRRDGPTADVFHSRLAASPDGRWLLSNGWVWHPCNVACVYDVARCLVDPAHLSTHGLTLDLGPLDADVDASTLSGDRLIASASAERPGLSIVELPSGKHLGYAEVPEYLGQRIMAWGADHIAAFHGHPAGGAPRRATCHNRARVGGSGGGELEPAEREPRAADRAVPGDRPQAPPIRDRRR